MLRYAVCIERSVTLHHWVHDLHIVVIFGIVGIHLHIRLLYNDSILTTLPKILHTIDTRDVWVDTYDGSPGVLKCKPEEVGHVHSTLRVVVL